MAKTKIMASILVVTGLIIGVTGYVNAKEKITTTTIPVVNVDTKISSTTSPGTMEVMQVKPAEGQVVLLNTEISEESVDYTIESLEKAGKSHDKVYLVISSPGGSVISGAKLGAYIEGSKTNVYTVCSEICASMAFHIFEAGKKRYMVDKSFLMGHPAAGGLRGTFPEMTSLLTALNTYVDRMDMKIAQRAGIPYEKFALSILKNLWIESQDAVNVHLADGLIHLTPQLSKEAVYNVDRDLSSKGIKLKTLRDSEIFKQFYETQ